jgi:hypothetical protein
MGHVTNARGFRLGHLLFWADRSASQTLATPFRPGHHHTLDQYFAFLFAQPRWARQGLAYNGLHLRTTPRGGLVITVTYYDGLLETFLLRHLLRRFLREGSPAGRSRRLPTTSSLGRGALAPFRRSLVRHCHSLFPEILSRRFGGDFGHLRPRPRLRLLRVNGGSVAPRLVGAHVLAKLRAVVSLKSILFRLARHFRTSDRYQGATFRVAGRFTRAEMAASRTEVVGRTPLNSLGERVDYGFAALPLKYGLTGVKVWLNHR